jgi:hypothetical protein
MWPLASSSRNSYMPVLSTNWGADCDNSAVRAKTIKMAIMAKRGNDIMPQGNFLIMVDTTFSVLC